MKKSKNISDFDILIVYENEERYFFDGSFSGKWRVSNKNRLTSIYKPSMYLWKWIGEYKHSHVGYKKVFTTTNIILANWMIKSTTIRYSSSVIL